MINFDYITKENIKEHNPNRTNIPNHQYKILITGDSGSGKTKKLFNLINQEIDTNKIYLYDKEPSESK